MLTHLGVKSSLVSTGCILGNLLDCLGLQLVANV